MDSKITATIINTQQNGKSIKKKTIILDKSCEFSKLNNITEMTFTNYIIENIEFPQNVETLIFKGCYFVQDLKTLPSNLKRLEIIGGEIRFITFLPKSLEFLNCYQCKLREIVYLPESLTEFHCNFNQVKVLPAFPEKLTILNCEQCQLISLKQLPRNLKTLNCGYNEKLKLIPKLPESLEIFEYQGCYDLISIPDIPHSVNNQTNNIQKNNIQKKKSSIKSTILYYLCFIDQ